MHSGSRRACIRWGGKVERTVSSRSSHPSLAFVLLAFFAANHPPGRSLVMNRTRIKICGITRPADALAAANAGADAIGIVLHRDSPRGIHLHDAAEIIRALPCFVTPVALFVDAPVDEVLSRAASLGIRHVQLHGHESPEMVAQLKNLVILKAMRADRQTLAGELLMWNQAMTAGNLRNLRGLVLETAAAAPGGTGVANDWELIEELQRQRHFDGLPPIIAAGGLTPSNVGAVVRQLRPWAVDVSSGVEESRGMKSPAKIDAFIRAVREAV